jgi:hypothetical protein
MKEQLDKLHALQNLQNAERLEERVSYLESAVDSLQSTVADLNETIGQLQMDLHREKSKQTPIDLTTVRNTTRE